MPKEMPRVCLVGCGQIGATHARRLTKASDLYFCSRSWTSARHFQKKFLGRGVLADFDKVLESDIDAVVIASPPEFHAQQVICALQAQKAVLVEKPLCISPGELESIEKAMAEATNPLLMVAENYYYKPSLQYLKGLIARGELGPIQSLLVRKLSTQKAVGWKSAHGALLEGGIHFIALICDFFDLPAIDVEAVFPGRDPVSPERNSITRLTFANRVTAELRYSWNTPSLLRGVFQHSRMDCTHGTIHFESNGMYAWHSGSLRPIFPGFRDLMGYGAMTRDFMKCLEDRFQVPYSNFERAKRDLNIVFRAYQGQEDA
ncbi:MAG: Gfo/Idh/MocA family oxidoreductase [bacterium]|jgi:predicted dehydrogenase|nr:Gfo/Idh/MocA family oxidoreductase [bacterium]